MGKIFNKIKSKFSKKKAQEIVEEVKLYDVNAPISEYTEEQIIARIRDEITVQARLESSAAVQYKHLYDIEKGTLRCCEYLDIVRHYDVSDEYFLNDFFVEAVRRKMKKIIYRELKKDIAYSNCVVITPEFANNRLAELDEAISNHISRAKSKIKVHTENANNESAIDEIFSDVIDN